MILVTSNRYDIEIFNLTKKYKLKGKKEEILALDNINLKIEKGEIFGLLGPNGAGKTTLVSILTTLIKPTSGYATILGENILKKPWFVRENVGLMFGGDMIYLRLTGFKNLKFFCKIYGIKNYKKKIYEIAEKLNLSDWLSQYVGYYSSGMKLKLALARVLLTEPRILFLDEPMLGLDPKTVQEVIYILKSLEKTILLTSHQMDVVEQLCERIAFLKKGKILMVDTQEKIKKFISDKINIRIIIKEKVSEVIESLKKLDFVSNLSSENEIIDLIIKNENYIPNLFNILKDYPVIKFSQIEPDLGEIFIKFNL